MNKKELFAKLTTDNHYHWLERHFSTFTKALGLEYSLTGLISAHGDKCYSYRVRWENNGIPFFHGVAIYLLTYVFPYSKESRETDNGWVPPVIWVVDNYDRFKEFLPGIKE